MEKNPTNWFNPSPVPQEAFINHHPWVQIPLKRLKVRTCAISDTGCKANVFTVYIYTFIYNYTGTHAGA